MSVRLMSYLRVRKIARLGVFIFAIFSYVSVVPAQSTTPTSSTPGMHSNAPVLIVKLVGNLSTKSAKAGDPVAARVVEELKLKDLDIPKGSKLAGAVTAVQSKDAGNGTSSLAVRFDHVELKGNEVLRIQGLIVAIGPVSNSDGLGANSVLSRGGAGSTPGLDPSMEVGHSGNRDDIPGGSTLEGVALGTHIDTEGATELRGVHRDIRLDSDVMMKVALYKGK